MTSLPEPCIRHAYLDLGWQGQRRGSLSDVPVYYVQIGLGLTLSYPSWIAQKSGLKRILCDAVGQWE